MFKNIQNKENNDEMKEISQQNLEKQINDATSKLAVKEMNVWDKLEVLQKQILLLFQLVDDLSLSLDRIEKQIKFSQSTPSKSFSNANYRRKKKRIVSLTPSDLEESGEDIGQTDSTRSEDTDPNSDERNAMIEDLDTCMEFMESDGTYHPSQDEELDDEDEFFTEESSVEMLSRSIVNIVLEKSEKGEN